MKKFLKEYWIPLMAVATTAIVIFLAGFNTDQSKVKQVSDDCFTISYENRSLLRDDTFTAGTFCRE